MGLESQPSQYIVMKINNLRHGHEYFVFAGVQNWFHSCSQSFSPVLFNNSFKAIQVIMRFQYSARSRETFASNL